MGLIGPIRLMCVLSPGRKRGRQRFSQSQPGIQLASQGAMHLARSPFAIRHSPPAVRHSPFATRHSPFAIRHSPVAIRQSPVASHKVPCTLTVRQEPNLINLHRRIGAGPPFRAAPAETADVVCTLISPLRAASGANVFTVVRHCPEANAQFSC